MKKGIPEAEEVLNILKSEQFKSQENYNNHFLEKHSKKLSDYRAKWVLNPLWQWSRIYEYPFVENCIQEYLKNKNDIRILDGGSGITFLPFRLAEKSEISEIFCLDYDEQLKQPFDEIGNPKVKFLNGSLDKLSFKDNSIDIIYCISVLEHTDKYEEILKEFKRVIKNNGLIIITFDIGISKFHKLNIENSNILISLINKIILDPSNLINKLELKGTHPWTTKKANKLDEDLLPYPKQKFYKKLKNRIFGRDNFPNLTFYVLSTVVTK